MAMAISADLTRRDNQSFRLRAPFFAAIITAARHQILIQIVALFSSKLSRCTNGQICQRQRQAGGDMGSLGRHVTSARPETHLGNSELRGLSAAGALSASNSTVNP
jgi:hypothetical protein